MRRLPASIWAFSTKPAYADAAAIARKSMERLKNEEIDAVYLMYNEFKSVMAQKLTMNRILPVEARRSRRADGLYLRAAAGGNAGVAAAAVRGDRSCIAR